MTHDSCDICAMWHWPMSHLKLITWLSVRCIFWNSSSLEYWEISQILANISCQPYVYIITSDTLISSFLTLLSDTENEQLRWIPDESPGRLPVVVSTSKFRKILKCFWINIVWTLTQKRKSINANWEKLSLKRCKCSECSM